MEGIVRLGFGEEFEAEGEYLDGEIVKTDTHGRPIRVRSSHTGRMWELRYARPDDTEATEAEPIQSGVGRNIMKILHIIDRESVTGNTPTDLLAELRIDVDASLDAYADPCRVAVLAEYPGADYEVRFDVHCGEDDVMVGDEPDDDTEQDIREIASRVYARHGFWRYLPIPDDTEATEAEPIA